VSYSITVVTLTHGRSTLARALRSVQAQDYTGRVEHLILIDDSPAARQWFEAQTGLPENVEWRYIPREPGGLEIPGRLAALRNLSAQLADTDLIAFLDDDNEFEPNHLSSLVACMASTGCPAVHSQRTIVWPDGSPYLDQRCPWHRDRELAERLYKHYCDIGVFRPGSNIILDRVDPDGTPDPVYFVDTSEWLMERRLLLENPIPTHFTSEDCINVITEDTKMRDTFIAKRIPIAGSQTPTLKYYLGGYSNTYRQEQDHDSWV
jgi:glycosyltransferase involved in cell wall biosynthesis